MKKGFQLSFESQRGIDFIRHTYDLEYIVRANHHAIRFAFALVGINNRPHFSRCFGFALIRHQTVSKAISPPSAISRLDAVATLVSNLTRVSISALDKVAKMTLSNSSIT